MTLKYSGDIRELCYPFIYEDSPLCDYEIITDELCATLAVLSVNLMATNGLPTSTLFSAPCSHTCSI